jgi:hypothetical protein
MQYRTNLCVASSRLSSVHVLVCGVSKRPSSCRPKGPAALVDSKLKSKVVARKATNHLARVLCGMATPGCASTGKAWMLIDGVMAMQADQIVLHCNYNPGGTRCQCTSTAPANGQHGCCCLSILCVHGFLYLALNPGIHVLPLQKTIC